MRMLEGFGLNVCVGPEVLASRDHQVALLTIVNAARRTFLGGVRIVGALDAPLHVPIVTASDLSDAVRKLGGIPASETNGEWPTALIGTVASALSAAPIWQVTWDIWRGGVVPARHCVRLPEKGCGGVAPALAAGICTGEAFAYHAADHILAGKRSAGISLWRPTEDWLLPIAEGPVIKYLPSDLWLIGLGNLGQAYLWLLGCLDYDNPSDLKLLLQDTDRLALSNDSTSLLTQADLLKQLKTRALAGWCEMRGFGCALEERLFGPWSKHGPFDPPVALCGVDNALARASLESAGFGLVVETGLGTGPQSFRNLSLHTFPSTLSATKLWTTAPTADAASVLSNPAYAPEANAHLDQCGLAQLASRTVGVPFVGLISGCFAIGELLRRLHGGDALELLSLSTVSLADVDNSTMAGAYDFGFAKAALRYPVESVVSLSSM
jgi:hypothetical protein